VHPMLVDVITPIPTRWSLCRACATVLAHAGLDDAVSTAALDDLPPDWRRQFVELIAVLQDLGRSRAGQVRFRLIDPRSLSGLWLSLRHGVRTHPTFLIPGRRAMAGLDRTALSRAIAAGSVQSQPLPWWPRFARALRDFLYGATVYEMVRDLNKERGQIEHLFVLVVFGDFLGIPVLPPYYTLRLLPHVVPAIRGWKLSMLRERDITDLFVEEIH
jgi:hypothetical protein